jgi:hypothetical protein
MTHYPPHEIQIMDRIQAGLERCVGKEKAANTRFIIDKLKAEGIEISGPKLREYIHHLRVYRKMFIVGDDAGYYVAEKYDERVRQLKSLKSRMDEIQEVYEALLSCHKSSNVQQQIF